MTHILSVCCPTCGCAWEEDLDWHREHESIHTLYPGPRRKAGTEVFRFRCPQDGTWVPVNATGARAVDVDREDQGG
jgi:hypothetical protein